MSRAKQLLNSLGERKVNFELGLEQMNGDEVQLLANGKLIASSDSPDDFDFLKQFLTSKEQKELNSFINQMDDDMTTIARNKEGEVDTFIGMGFEFKADDREIMNKIKELKLGA